MAYSLVPKAHSQRVQTNGDLMNGRRQLPRRRGFSLVESALAIVIVGIGIVAVVASLGAASRINGAGRNLTRGVFLAQEIREWTLRLPFKDPDPGDAGKPPGPDGTNPQLFVDDLDDLLNVTYGPPRDGQGRAISGLAGWSQVITMTWRDPDSLTTTVPVGTSDVICVTVTIRHGDEAILATNWVVTRRT